MSEKEKIKALFEAVQALQEEGYILRHDRIFTEGSATSLADGKSYKSRQLNFSLVKPITLNSDEEEIGSMVEVVLAYEKSRQ